MIAAFDEAGLLNELGIYVRLVGAGAPATVIEGVLPHSARSRGKIARASRM